MNTPILSFTVDRKTWRRGFGLQTNCGTTALLNNRGFKCCLGFACLAAGATEHEILGKVCPDRIQRHLVGLTEMGKKEYDGVYVPTRFTDDAMNINDSELFGDEEREKRLIQLGQEENIEVKFEG